MLSAPGLQSVAHRGDHRPSPPPAKPLPKSKIWPAPKFRALVAAGVSPANLMALRALHAAVPSKPRATFQGAGWRHAEAIEAFRDAALEWVHSADQSPAVRFSKALLDTALVSVMTKAFGPASPNDPCYFTRRHVVDRLGCQLYALLGDHPPHRLIPLQPKLEKLSAELHRGWPAPRPAWEKRHRFLVPRHGLSVESRGNSSFARWPSSTASDRGVFQTFGDHTDAVDWLESLAPFLVFTDKPATRLLSSHDTQEQAIAALTA